MIPEIKKILYTTDLSENARYAFEYAMSLANRYEAGLTILHVLHVPSKSHSLVTDIIGQEKWNELTQDKTQVAVDKIRGRIEELCHTASTEAPACTFITDEILVKVGNPAEEILLQAEAGDYDMVVMGARGRGIMTDVMVGSVSRRVIKRCKKPVLVVHLPEEEVG